MESFPRTLSKGSARLHCLPETQFSHLFHKRLGACDCRGFVSSGQSWAETLGSCLWHYLGSLLLAIPHPAQLLPQGGGSQQTLSSSLGVSRLQNVSITPIVARAQKGTEGVSPEKEDSSVPWSHSEKKWEAGLAQGPPLPHTWARAPASCGLPGATGSR